MAPNIPAAKRAGLPVDLDRLSSEGDSWLSPEERYSLKMHGVCAQAQPGVFMIRIRTGGAVDVDAALGLADLADRYAKGWIHLTTRQQVQLHHVEAKNVVTVLTGLSALGLNTRSACGHTMRGVMWCPEAGVGLEEPFDCSYDALQAQESILARTPLLDTQMPQRINMSFGGCTRCREAAKVNDAGFVSRIGPDGELGYELWLGGSLGKSSPTLAVKAMDFLPRADLLAAVNALFDVFIAHGDFDQPAKARLKFLVKKMGMHRFLAVFSEQLAKSRTLEWPAPKVLSAPLSASIASILAQAPEGGWGSGVRPQRVPGWAMVTVNAPLGDVDTEDWRILTTLAADLADERLYLTANQNVMLRHVPLDAVPLIRDVLKSVGLGLEGADQSQDVRVCTGGPVCLLAITPSQRVGAEMLQHPALMRNSGLRVHISGCPNACAQHQIADLGFSGGKVTIGGVSMLGYQVWLGGDLRLDAVAQVAGRVAQADVYAITSAIVGVWEALRERGETLADTVARYGLDSFQAQISAIFKGRWESGPEPSETLTGPHAYRNYLPLAVGA
ncbi:MAG TPA: nitrite/sulfite reductase [Actinomycetota bacterium]|nr:nitrite/sulfite reductase [Actinomycetota bacterium]